MRPLLVAVALAALSIDARAQSVSVGVEAARDRFAYRFDNPSSFDTPQLVPHFFEQTYVADNVWLVAAVRYTAGLPWETSGGATLTRTLPATDFDTFVDPDAIIVAGTSGDAQIHSMRVAQRVELGRSGPVAFVAGYSVRYDRANFLVGHKSVSRNGGVVEAFDVTTREMTSSLTQEFFVGARLEHDVGASASGWRVAVGGDASPLVTARLIVELPDKYPGESFVFVANSFSGAARLTFMRSEADRRRIEISIAADRAWHYASANSFTRDRLSATATLAF